MKNLALLLLFFIHLKAFAFTLNISTGAAFEADEVKINVASITCNNIGVTNDELLSMAEEAAEQFWNRVATSRLTLVRGSIVSVDAAFGTSEINDSSVVVTSDILITCNTSTDQFPQSGILAVALPTSATAQTINGSSIFINDQANNQFKNKNREEQISILAHEIGHAIGLGHSNVEDSLMFFQSMANRSDLGEDDIAGVTFLYPREQPFGCGTVELNSSDNGFGDGLTSALFGLLLIMLLTGLRRLKAPKISRPSFGN